LKEYEQRPFSRLTYRTSRCDLALLDHG
jgi:hypothetical protein